MQHKFLGIIYLHLLKELLRKNFFSIDSTNYTPR